jgi:hypothetical protein
VDHIFAQERPVHLKQAIEGSMQPKENAQCQVVEMNSNEGLSFVVEGDVT